MGAQDAARAVARSAASSTPPSKPRNSHAAGAAVGPWLRRPWRRARASYRRAAAGSRGPRGERQREPRLSSLTAVRRRGRRRPARARAASRCRRRNGQGVGVQELLLRLRADAQRDLGDDAEHALGTEQQLAQAGPAAVAGQEGGQLAAGGGEQGDGELVDAPVAGRGLAGRARAGPAADGRELEALREVAERQPVRFEQPLDLRPRVPAPKVASWERRSIACSRRVGARSRLIAAANGPAGRLDAADDARAAAERTTAMACCAQMFSTAATGRGRRGRRRRRVRYVVALAQPQRRGTSGGGVGDAGEVVVAHVGVAADGGGELRAVRCGSADVVISTCSERHGAGAGAADAELVAQQRDGGAGERASWPSKPTPPAHARSERVGHGESTP